MSSEVKELASVDFLDQYQGKKPKGPVKREFVLSEEMKYMAEEIIRTERIDVHPAKIEYVTVEPNISKSTAAKCVKTGKELKFFSNLDYIIEVSGELWTALDKETRSILLEHELRHILVLQNDKSGDWAFKLKKHDIQDFGRIVSKHGVDWIKRVKLCLSSLYDLTPAEEDNIQI
ncbi:MAG: putative metallopeptidase [Ignavibacteriales bacterium]